jgi:2-polyprenyl-3-methyl-5-hydroxy-6-metoxy-1,4-benzoquinol methylase
MMLLQHYRQMIDDPVRLGAFGRAIAAVVRPGDVVADIGCGLGTYALFAARAGARRVFAVDDSPIVEVAREVVRDNGADDVVELIAGYSTALTPPERCDVVVFEDYLPTLLSPTKARVVHDLCARWLKPGGRLLPPRARLWLAPVEDAAVYLDLDRFHRTADRVSGIDFSATRRRVMSTPQPQKLGARALLTAPERAHDYDDFVHLGHLEVSVTRTLTSLRAGVVHGVLVWIDLDVGGSWLGTGPLAPPSSWQQILFPLPTPIPVAAGAPIDVALQAVPQRETLSWRWSVGAGGERAESAST